MTTTKDNIDRIIDEYHIRIADDGEHIFAPSIPKSKMAKANAEVGPNKDKIMARLRERQAEKDAEDARIAAIPGLKELREYRRAVEAHHDQIQRIMDSGDGRAWPKEPERPSQDYPQAQAYLALEGMLYASHDVKSSAGRRGIQRVRSGEQTPEEALAQAQSEWQAYCDDHAWD